MVLPRVVLPHMSYSEQVAMQQVVKISLIDFSSPNCLIWNPICMLDWLAKVLHTLDLLAASMPLISNSVSSPQPFLRSEVHHTVSSVASTGSMALYRFFTWSLIPAEGRSGSQCEEWRLCKPIYSGQVWSTILQCNAQGSKHTAI